jgi:STE24 endopeptidase
MTPQAAADAWLARLPTAERAQAAAHTDWRLAAFVFTGVAIIAVSVLVLRTGLLFGLRQRIERDGPRPWLASAAAAGLFGLLIFSTKALCDALGAWRGDAILGRDLSVGAALAGAEQWVLPATAALITVVPALHWLMRRAPRGWPLVAGALAAVALVTYGWLPYAMASAGGAPSLAPGPLRSSLGRLIADAHLPATDVYATTSPLDLEVSGGFGHAVVVVGPELVRAPPAEVAALAGHLMGHYAHNDIFSIWLVFGLLTLAGCLATSLLFRPAARVLGAAHLRGPAEPEGLPVLAVISVLAIGLGVIGLNGFIRYVNVGADEFSLTHAHAPDGLAAVLERRWDHESVDPPALERALFFSHPPLKVRLVRAMAWKAAHPGPAALAFVDQSGGPSMPCASSSSPSPSPLRQRPPAPPASACRSTSRSASA